MKTIHFDQSQGNRIIEVVLENLRKYSLYALEEQEKLSVNTKKDGSTVTKVDTTIEKELKNLLLDLIPSSTFIGEESIEEEVDFFDSEYIWAVDPIDGTTNYAYGFPHYAISIGLLKRVEEGLIPIGGFLSLPILNEIYFRIEDTSGFTRVYDNKRHPIRSAEQMKDSRSIVTLTNKFYTKYSLDMDKHNIRPLQLGCTVANIIYTAIGKSRGTLTSTHIWDFAGSIAIANFLDVYMWDPLSKKTKLSFNENDFVFENNKNTWKLKYEYFISTENNKLLLENLFRKK